MAVLSDYGILKNHQNLQLKNRQQKKRHQKNRHLKNWQGAANPRPGNRANRRSYSDRTSPQCRSPSSQNPSLTNQSGSHYIPGFAGKN